MSPNPTKVSDDHETGYLQTEVSLRWNSRVHVKGMPELDAFVSARRIESLDPHASFVTIYEPDIDVEAAKATLIDALGRGAMSRPAAVPLNPPSTVRFMRPIPTSRTERNVR
jgi:hypothetical protein